LKKDRAWRLLATVVARVRVSVSLCGICAGKRGTGEGFLWALQVLLTIIPLTVPHAESTVGLVVVDISKEFSIIIEKWK
jgi:hypothetical protein